MKRAIKFRGLRIEGKGWIAGYLYQSESHSWITDSININLETHHNIAWFKVKPESVGRSVGINDKNGNKVYEGDIVTLWLLKNGNRTRYFTGKVTDHGYSGFTIDTQSDYMEFGLKNYEYEIVGNIHQTPDLLTKQNNNNA